ncbi:MAG: hypothetical protein HQ464_09975 [Planctomycetes bacterium]|nr:hypothetical protein [Planctomycetota bacterium]
MNKPLGELSQFLVRIVDAALARCGMFFSREPQALRDWKRRGSPLPPPPAVKQQVLLSLAKRHSLRLFVETGTSFGDMVRAMTHHFDRIWTIELGDRLYAEAQEKFRDVTHVHLIHGDSGRALGHLLPQLDAPALFWLDAHYSGGPLRGATSARGEKDTPILEELDHILGAAETRHVVVIDDARLLGTDPSYPTLDAVAEFVLSRSPQRRMIVDCDCIQILPS